MYQRMLMCLGPCASLVDAENEGNEDADQLIRREEEDRGERDHHEHHDGGDRGLAPRRPGDLGGFAAHFLQEFERAESHRQVASVVARFFWNPNSPIAPNPHLEGEPQRGLDCPGMKKAAPEIRNGPAAGAAMYCAGSARSRRFACGKTWASGLGSDENRWRLKRLRGMAGWRPER